MPHTNRTKPAYWAVHRGFIPGVYDTYADVKAQVRGFGHELGASYSRFPRSARGLEEAKEFCLHGGQGLDDDDGDGSEDSDDDEQDNIMVVSIGTNYGNKTAHDARARIHAGLPQYSILFNMDMNDRRNMFSLFRMPRPTTNRILLAGVVALLRFIDDPQSSKMRRENDPYMEYEIATIPGIEPSVHTIIVTLPSAALVETLNETVGSPPKGKWAKGLLRTIASYLQKIRQSRDVSFVLEQST